MVNIHLLYLIQTKTISQVCTGGVFWISIQKKLLIFYSLRLQGFKSFFVDNDEKIIDELLYNFRKCNTSLNNQRLTLCAMKFSLEKWGKNGTS